jgi:hypothetical protein
MTLGVYGTGPYGKINSLRNIISNCEYELQLMEMGVKSTRFKKGYLRTIAECKEKIKAIRTKEKARKKQKLH